MPTDRSEVSSLAATLDQLVGRLVRLAETAAQERDERVSGELFAAERSLVAARRRLERLLSASR